MIAKQEILKKIKYHFGLNVYESKVWLALLSRNVASVGEIAEMSGVPRSRVYDVLESLEKQGFTIAKLGKPLKYIAVKPHVVIERLKSNFMKESENRIKNLSTVRGTAEFKELEQLYDNGIEPVRVEDLSSSIRGRANVHNHIKEMINQAKKEVILVSSLSDLKRKAHFLKPSFEKLRGDNVKILVALGGENEDDKEALANLPRLLGVPIRRIKTSGRFCIVDGEKVLVTITPETEDEDIAISLTSPFFSKAMASFIVPNLKTQ